MTAEDKKAQGMLSAAKKAAASIGRGHMVGDLPPPPPPPPSAAVGGAGALPAPPPGASGGPVRIKGSVYTAGYGHLGHLGGNFWKTVAAEPQPVGGLVGREDIVDVACGHYTTVARSIYGEAFGWGSNRTGTLNTGRYVDMPQPACLGEIEDTHYAQIALGADFGLALHMPGTLGDHAARKAASRVFGKWRRKSSRHMIAVDDEGGLNAMMGDIASDEGISDELKALGMDFSGIINALLRANEEAAAQSAAEDAARSAESASLSVALAGAGDEATSQLLASLMAIDKAAAASGSY